MAPLIQTLPHTLEFYGLLAEAERFLYLVPLTLRVIVIGLI